MFFWVPTIVALVTAVQMAHACRGVREEHFKQVDEGSHPGAFGGLEEGGITGPSRDGSTGDSLGAGEIAPLLAPHHGSSPGPQSSWSKMRRILSDPAVYAVIIWSFFYVRICSTPSERDV